MSLNNLYSCYILYNHILISDCDVHIIFRRQVKKSKSMIQLLLFGDETNEDDIKSKNIRQTGELYYAVK